MPSRSQLIAGHQGAVLAVRKATVANVTALWRVQQGFRDGDVEQFTRRVVPMVQASQVRIASLTSAYIARMANEPVVPVVRTKVTMARGVSPVEVYTRPAVRVRTDLSRGIPYPVAVASGLTRLVSLTSTDMQLAKTAQAQASMARSKFPYFARVLGAGKNCDLCVIASTQRYGRENLMPIHPGCNCGVEPITSGDWDLTPSPEADLITVHEHGEYGPTLAYAADEFTGPSDL